MTRSKVSRNVPRLYILRFFHSLIPAYVIERLYWEQKGMTIQDVVYTEILYAVTIVLLDYWISLAATLVSLFAVRYAGRAAGAERRGR